MSAWSSSGVSIMTTSAHLAASATSMTFRPSFSAFCAEAEPLRRAMATFWTPESRMLSAWAPCEPPNTSSRCRSWADEGRM